MPYVCNGRIDGFRSLLECQNEKVAIKFIIVGVIITIFVLGNILYFYIFKEL